MKINQEGIDLIKLFESLKLKAYLDPVGVLTIGYGTTRIDGKPVKIGTTITEKQAEEYLMKDLIVFEKCVSDTITVTLNENQFSALVSFVYNLGCGSLKKSTLAKRLNRGDYNVDDEFGKWVKAGGKVLAGLVRRREAEKNLFEKDEGSTVEPVKNESSGSVTEGIKKVLKKGMRGEAVKIWQEFLNDNGFDCGKPDGIFSTNTEKATKKYQSANGLTADGVAGKDTLGKANLNVEAAPEGVRVDGEIWDKIKDLGYTDWKNIFNKHLDWSIANNRVAGSPAWNDEEGILNVIGIRCNDERDFNYGKYNDYLVIILNRPDDNYRKDILKVTVDPAVPNAPGVKNRAHLCQGVWNSYRIRPHAGGGVDAREFPKIGYQKRWAICQYRDTEDSSGKKVVVVARTDSQGGFVNNDKGFFTINIHDSGGYRDSSIGCTVIQSDNDYVDNYLPYLYDIIGKKIVPKNNEDLTYCLINQTQLEKYLQ